MKSVEFREIAQAPLKTGERVVSTFFLDGRIYIITEIGMVYEFVISDEQ